MISDIDKSTWTSVKLGDVVVRKEDNDKEHAKEQFDVFIKVEHMDPESLHLKRWGHQGNEELPPTFYKIFRKGHILFPTRNPHLRRTALAHFDGICGEKTLTLEPSAEIVDSNFIPFLFHSERFVAHTTSSIIGSTNPHVRWRDIAKYEFLLPPKNEQGRLADLLWATDDLAETRLILATTVENLKKSYECYYFGKSQNDKLRSVILRSYSGGTPDTKRTEYYSDGTIPWVTTKIMNEDFIDEGEKFISEKALNNSAAKLLPADNMLAGIRVGVGKFAINKAPISFSQDVTGLEIDKKKVDLEFLVYQLNSFVIQNRIKPLLRGSTIKGITKNDLLELPIFLNKIDNQVKVRNALKSVRMLLKQIMLDAHNVKKVRKSLIEEIFSAHGQYS
jgi:type I restriction enzyme S subunit